MTSDGEFVARVVWGLLAVGCGVLGIVWRWLPLAVKGAIAGIGVFFLLVCIKAVTVGIPFPFRTGLVHGFEALLGAPLAILLYSLGGGGMMLIAPAFPGVLAAFAWARFVPKRRVGDPDRQPPNAT